MSEARCAEQGFHGSVTSAYGFVTGCPSRRGYPYGRAPLPRDDLRLPDERSRQRAHQGHARGARTGGGGDTGRRGCRRLQHLHDPREARHEACCVPRRGGRAEARGAGPGDRRRRLLRRGAARPDLRALSRRSTSRSVRARSRTSASGSAQVVSASPAAGSVSTIASSRPSCRRTTSVHSRRGFRSRWAATRSARTASSLRCAAASRSRRPGEILAEVQRLAAGGVREVTLLGQNVNSWGRDLAPDLQHRVRRAAARLRRGRRDRADPVHEPAPEGLPRAGDRRDGRMRRPCASTSIFRSSPARRAS